MRRRSPPLRPLLLAGAAVLFGCADPYQRAGTWHATGVNDDNLRAMLADPADLAWGVALPGSDGQAAAAAVARLRGGQVKALPAAAPQSGASPAAGGG
jgi:type IV pilus biogenesis protein CpaD/CtpE